MSRLSLNLRFPLNAWIAVILTIGSVASPGEGLQVDQQKTPAVSRSNGGMAHMSGHMYMTSLRPQKAGDQEKAQAIVTAARAAMAPYQDYRKALADGYEIFLPNVPQSQYHFTRHDIDGAWSIDPPADRC